MSTKVTIDPSTSVESLSTANTPIVSPSTATTDLTPS